MQQLCALRSGKAQDTGGLRLPEPFQGVADRERADTEEKYGCQREYAGEGKDRDDFTPMDFVVEILVQIFDKDLEAAVELMLSVHHGSYAVAGIYPRDMAQTKAAEAVRRARAQGYPLKVEAVCQP